VTDDEQRLPDPGEGPPADRVLIDDLAGEQAERPPGTGPAVVRRTAFRPRSGRPTEAVAEQDRERFFGVKPLRALFEAGTVAVLAWCWAAVLYRLWDASLRVPIYQDRSDARLIANIVKNITTRGWFETNPHLGAPYGQKLYDFPHGGETFQLVFIKILSLFTKDYGLLMNVYYIGGFGVTAAVTFLVLRHLRFTYGVSALIATLYVFLPFHFYHEQSHLFRSSYYYAPIACLVLLWAMQWRERFLRDPLAVGPDGRKAGAIATLRWTLGSNLRWRRVAFMVVVLVFLGGTETMTTCFTLVLLALTGIIGAIVHREPARLLASFAMVGVLGVTFVAFLSPTILYVHDHGNNALAARRQATEQELYGLKISRMVLPSGDHRSTPMRDLGNKAQAGTLVLSEGGQALTTLGTIGFFSALVWLLARRWGRPRGEPPDVRPPWDRTAVLDDGAILVLLSTLVGTIAGLAMVLSVLGFSQVRVWNRIVLIIAFFAFAFTGHWFEKLGRWIQGKLTRSAAIPLLVVLLLGVGAFGLWDGGRPAGRDYRAMDADFASDKAFVARIEASVPAGTSIFQLPVTPFPESPPPARMLDYDQMRPILQSNGSTNWSYGAVKGRPEADWQWLRVRNHIGAIGSLPGLLGMGFTGIWLDTNGYDDGGKLITTQLTNALGQPPIVSSNGRMEYFDMRPYRDRLGKSPAELRAIAKQLFLIDPP